MIQRRQDGSVEFFRNWTEYENGFGNLVAEFWLGLKKIHRLTKSGHKTLRIDMTELEKNETAYHANYSHFYVSNETEQYKLKVFGYTGMNYTTNLLGLILRMGGFGARALYLIKHS